MFEREIGPTELLIKYRYAASRLAPDPSRGPVFVYLIPAQKTNQND